MPTFTHIWEYRVRDGCSAEFMQHYGPLGSWVRLFQRASGYVSTSLSQDAGDPSRFVSIDHWRRRADWEAFRAAFAAEYEALDARCSELTTSETCLFAGEELDRTLAAAAATAVTFERQRGSHLVTTDMARIDIAAVHATLAASYWSPGIPIAILERGIAHSLAFGLLEDERTIGFARAITDRATYAYLADVYVDASRRGRGLGTWLVECVLAHPDLQGLRRLALVTRDAHGLYAKFGFTALAAPERHLEIVRPASELYGI
jgi:GNAT superfamily N-acetyltransferase